MRIRGRKQGRNRAGFTLAEILVVAAIIAVLAAAVIPAVATQSRRGQLSRMGTDLTAMRTGVEGFVGDVHRYPASVGQLTNLIKTTMHWVAPATMLYSGPDSARWHGPYLQQDSTDAIQTSLTFALSPTFFLDSLAASGDHNATFPNGTPYLVVTIPGVDTTTAADLDAMYDDGNTQTGSIRWRKNPGGGKDTLKFLAILIQP